MDVWCKNTTYSIFKHTRKGENDLPFLTLHAARGGHVSGLIALRDVEDFSLDAVEATVSRPEDIAVTVWLQGYQRYNDERPYPDRPLAFAPCTVKANATQSLLLQFAVADAAAPGSVTADVTVRTGAGEQHVRIVIKIYDVLIPAAKDGALDHEYFFSYDYGDAFGHPVPSFTPAWWDIYATQLREMAAMRINVLHFALWPLLNGFVRKTGAADWSVDFSRLDEFIHFSLEHGAFRRLELGAPLRSLTGETITGFDEEGREIALTAQTPECEAYVRCVFGALYGHFKEKGWLGMLLMHIADEPHQTDNWLWMRGLMREVMPGVPCGEPLDQYSSALELAEDCDIFIPRFEVYEQGRDFFEQRQAAGKTVWAYSCCYPEEPWYLNKFIDLPAAYARMVKWALYAQGITGYLHWGLNFWNAALYGLDPAARFKGDGFILYPDAGRQTFAPSNRAIASMEGVEDYELLCLLAKRDPAAARALARSVAATFRIYKEDPDVLELARIRLLTLCEA